MQFAQKFVMCGLALLSSLPSAAAQSGKLLPTASLAKEVEALNGSLTASPPYISLEKRRLSGLALRDRISQFIIDQVGAKPDITREQLKTQLQAILCQGPNAECGDDHPPYVFANVWFGPNGPAQFAVAYQLSLGFMGPNGSITVVESYSVQNGTKVRRAARGGSEFDACVANFQLVQQFFDPAEVWVLAWGTVQGASGRGLSGRAAMYRLGTDAVKIAWDDAGELNVVAQANALGWELSYADPQLLYGNDPKVYSFDVYEIDYTKRTFSRVVHYQHAAD